MISVRYRTAPDVPWIRVEIPDNSKLEAVLIRAGERAGRQLEGKELDAHVARYNAARLEFAEKRAALKAKAEKR